MVYAGTTVDEASSGGSARLAVDLQAVMTSMFDREQVVDLKALVTHRTHGLVSDISAEKRNL